VEQSTDLRTITLRMDARKRQLLPAILRVWLGSKANPEEEIFYSFQGRLQYGAYL
jgi:hypothetical protein